jgi:hypothetical protein
MSSGAAQEAEEAIITDGFDWELDLENVLKISVEDFMDSSYGDYTNEFGNKSTLGGLQDLDEDTDDSSRRKDHHEASRCAFHPGADDVPKKRKQNRRRRSRRQGGKKPAGMPKRGLSAYNLFFQKERPKIFADFNSRIGFEKLGKIIGSRWRTLSSEDRRKYEQEATKEGIRYRKEMDIFDDSRRRRFSDPQVKVSESSPRSAIDGCYKDAKAIPLLKAFPPARALLLSGKQLSRQESIASCPPSLSSPSRTNISYMPSSLPDPYNVRATQSYYAYPHAYDPSPNAYHYYQGGYNPSPRAYTPIRSLSNQEIYPTPFQEVAVDRDQTVSPSISSSNSPSLTSEMNVPSGTEFVIPDEYGNERHYRMSYSCFRMTQAEAREYMKRLEEPCNFDEGKASPKH